MLTLVRNEQLLRLLQANIRLQFLNFYYFYLRKLFFFVIFALLLFFLVWKGFVLQFFDLGGKRFHGLGIIETITPQ